MSAQDIADAWSAYQEAKDKARTPGAELDTAWLGEPVKRMVKAMDKFKYEAQKEFGNDVLVQFTPEGCIVNNIMVFLDNGQN